MRLIKKNDARCLMHIIVKGATLIESDHSCEEQGSAFFGILADFLNDLFDIKVRPFENSKIACKAKYFALS